MKLIAVLRKIKSRQPTQGILLLSFCFHFFHDTPPSENDCQAQVRLGNIFIFIIISDF